MFPNWIIAGAPKAGTSSLFRWLTDHPDVTGPLEKETYYFVDPGTHMFRSQRNFYEGGLAGYSKLFDSCDRSSKIIIKSTPGYVYSKTALRELPALPSAPRFIFVLREPVAQLRSLFTYFQQNWNWIPRDKASEPVGTRANAVEVRDLETGYERTTSSAASTSRCRPVRSRPSSGPTGLERQPCCGRYRASCLYTGTVSLFGADVTKLAPFRRFDAACATSRRGGASSAR